MKHTRTIGLMAAGFFLIVAIGLLASTSRALAAGQPVASSLQSLNRASAGSMSLAPEQAYTCTVNITTTDSIPFNQRPDSPAPVASYTSLALVPSPTYPFPPGNQVPALDDWFIIGNATPNFQYTFEAVPDAVGNYNLGMEIYTSTSPSLLYLANVDTGDGNSAKITTAFPGPGPYYIRIFQISSFCSGGTYHINFSYTSPTGTPTRTPSPTRTITPTPGPFACVTGSDRFEPNGDFDTASTIGLGVKYDNLNFVECITSDGSWDNDYFRVRVKPGMLVTCHTLNLSAGTDTNLILYDDSRNGINGSDDVNRAAGDLSSSVTYFVTYEGWLYGLVGEGFHRQPSEQAAATYSYECLIAVQTTPTPTPTPTEAPGQPTRTPVPPTPTITLTPSPTLSPTPPFIKILPLPTVTPPGLPTSNIPVSLQVYYDENNNRKPDPGEGVSGVSVRVFDLVTGRLLAQNLTDDTGRVSLTVNAPGAVQLVVPYFNFSYILPTGGQAVIRISPGELPQSIP